MYKRPYIFLGTAGKTTLVYTARCDTKYIKKKEYNKTDNVNDRLGGFVQQLLKWKSNRYYNFCVRVSSIKYPACIAHAPYCHLWPVRLYSIF